MKQFLLYFTFFLSLNISTFAQWHQSLTGQNSLIKRISVVDDDNIWIISQYSENFSYTSDGGQSWSTKDFPVGWAGYEIGNIHAINSTTAFLIKSAGTNRGIYKTVDNGDNWVLQSSGFNDTNSFPNMICFFNITEGVAIGDPLSSGYFEIYTTNDGGANWNIVPNENMPIHLAGEYTYNINSCFRTRGNSFYFITNKGRIFISNNKGYNWSVIETPLPDGEYNSFDFKDGNIGLCSYSKPNEDVYELYSTSDGGLNWT